jgi:hypothetical protein
MARVLLSGDNTRLAALDALLSGCEHRVTRLDESFRASRYDALVHACPDDCAVSCPVLLAGADRVPLLIVGAAACPCVASSWPRGRVGDLVLAPAALAELLAARGSADADPRAAFGSGRGERGGFDLAGYAEFLGHELRTPLAVVRNALESLAELADRTARSPEPSPDQLDQLVALAHRNVTRLERSVGWSEDCLRSLALSDEKALTTVSLAEAIHEPVRAAIDELGAVRVDLPGKPRRVRIDRAALAAFVRQLLRAFRIYYDDDPLELAAVADADRKGGDHLRLIVRADTGGRGVARGRPASRSPGLRIRAGLDAGPAIAPELEARFELTRVLRYTVPQVLVDRVEAAVCLGGRPDKPLFVTADLSLTGAEEAATALDAEPDAECAVCASSGTGVHERR